MSYGEIEETVQRAVEWLRLLVETLGALVIAAGIVVAIIGLCGTRSMPAARPSRPSNLPSHAT